MIPDRIPSGPAGRRRRLLVLLICSSSLFMTYGLAAFSLGSLLCSLAPNTGSLIALRMLQALGGSMLTPVSLSIVRNVFTDPKERAQALGIWSGIFGLATACGPVVGGALVSGVGWRSVFWVNVPIGLAMMAAARRYVPESRAPHPRRVDAGGQALMIVLLGSLTYAVIQGPSSGWASPVIVAFFAVALVALTAFILTERRRAQPLLELRFFRNVLGVAVMGAMLTASLRSRLAAGTPRDLAFSDATHGPWALAVACGLLIAVAGLAATTARGRAAARVAAAEEG